MPRLSAFVPAEESVLVRLEGTLRDRRGSSDVVLGTTGRSLVYRSDADRFGVLPHEHVSAVESRDRTLVEYDLEDYRLFVGGGAALSLLTFLGGILASGLLGLVLLLATVGGIWLVEHGWRHREEYDGVERFESEIEEVVVHTDAGASWEFLFPREARAGAELGRFVGSEHVDVEALPRRPHATEPAATD